MSEIWRAHSGFADLLGYQLTERKVDQAEVTLKVGPQHLNRLSIRFDSFMEELSNILQRQIH